MPPIFTRPHLCPSPGTCPGGSPDPGCGGGTGVQVPSSELVPTLAQEALAALRVAGAPGLANAAETGAPGSRAIAISIAFQLAAFSAKQTRLTGPVLRTVRIRIAALRKRRHFCRQHPEHAQAECGNKACNPSHAVTSVSGDLAQFGCGGDADRPCEPREPNWQLPASCPDQRPLAGKLLALGPTGLHA